MKTKTALIINAHPDDAEMAMGGSLFLLKNSGFRIINASLTKGGSGSHGGKEIREKEFLQAQTKIGSTPVLMDYPDTALENNLETRLSIVKLIREYKPEIVFSPYLRNDLANFDGIMNRDHAVAGAITSEAVKLARLKGVLPQIGPHKVNALLFYMVPTGLNPNYLFDVSPLIGETIDLIKTYKSQVEHTEYLDFLIAMRKNHGQIIRVKYAEAFVSEMPLLVNKDNFSSLFA